MPAPLTEAGMTTGKWQEAIQAGLGDAVNATTDLSVLLLVVMAR